MHEGGNKEARYVAVLYEALIGEMPTDNSCKFVKRLQVGSGLGMYFVASRYSSKFSINGQFRAKDDRQFRVIVEP